MTEENKPSLTFNFGYPDAIRWSGSHATVR